MSVFFLTAVMAALWPAAPPAAPGLILEDSRALTTAGPSTDPAWSLDGRSISFSGPGHRGLSLVSLAGELQRLASPEALSGFRHRWLDQPPRILLPARGTQAARVLETDGSLLDARYQPLVRAQRDDIWLATSEGSLRLTQGEDRFFDPQLSPDGRWLAFVGLASGLHVMDLQRDMLHHLGPGGRPAWSPDSAWLVFERTQDDGARLTAADLWAWSVQGRSALALSSSDDAQERHPAVSPDGTMLAFVRDGAIWVGALREVER